LFNAAFAMQTLVLISRIHLASFVIIIPKQLKYFLFPGYSWSVITCIRDSCLEILITFVFFYIHFHSTLSSYFKQPFIHVLQHCFFLS
jgi:hypothetical protein